MVAIIEGLNSLIGALENNYMNVRGDLKHTIWKRRLAKDDIVLERRKGRVRVLNDSAGVWQITREALRLSHQLYVSDKRHHSKLPEYLKDLPRELNVNEVDSDVLTLTRVCCCDIYWMDSMATCPSQWALQRWSLESQHALSQGC